MNVYIRKMFEHDITHEVSVTRDIVESFFSNQKSFYVTKNGNDKKLYTVTINNATDPRFGGDFKALYSGDNVSVDDCLVIYKLAENRYDLKIIKKGSSSYDVICSFFKGPKDRHAVIFTEQKNTTTEFKPSSYSFDYASAIKTKPFLILGGFSGTGKSQKVKEIAFSTCPCDDVLNIGATSPGNYQLIPVKPNWHDATELTGFYSSVNRNYYVTDFMRFLVKAKQYESQRIPFFVCLDEMNLAPVEEYFADFLSIIESRKRLDDGRIVTDALVPASVFNDTSYDDDFNVFMSLGLKTVNEEASVSEVNAQIKEGESEIFDRQDIVDDLKANGLTLPQNVVVIGTVNMDDTTNTFSRKVIDRAMTFETLVTKFDETDYFDKQPLLGYIETPIPGFMILPDEVNANQMLAENRFDLSPEDKTSIIGFINDVNSDLEGTPFKISYRIINETILLYRANKKLKEDFERTEDVNLNQVFDDILMQKVLPRIEGDYDKCNACLSKLSSRAAERNWSKCYEKLEFMISRFGKDHCGFTSFWN